MSPVVEVTARQVHLSTHVAAFAYSERRSEFATRVAESVGRVFDSLMGSGAREAVFLHMASAREVSQWDIVDKPALFMEGLHGIFGDGARPMEAAIVDELRIEFGLELPVQGEKLADILKRAGFAPSRLSIDVPSS